jgi:ABC-2 type transport system ATP-binding protein
VNDPIAVERLTKRYGARTALDGVTLSVAAGEVVGLLGPNGAGKSTTLGVLATLLPFDGGRVAVMGHGLPGGAAAARRVLGHVPQQLALYPTLSARENLRFFGRALGLGRSRARTAADDALGLLGLDARADEPVTRFSGGMRRRLNLGCGILHHPRVLLLDEPAVGVDPQSRERLFEAVRALAAAGTAILYSTHHIDEAERLCDRVVLLDAGRVVATGTPAALVARTGIGATIRLRTTRPLASGWLGGLGGRVDALEDGSISVALDDPAAVPAVLAAALRAGEEVLDFMLHRPTLADAFFALTGRALRDEEPDAEP